MIRSMTGFARCELQQEWGSLVWEVRALNHRYLEVNVRLPEELRGLEVAVREKVGKKLSRGKVECNLRYQRHPGALCEMRLNREQAGRVMQMYSEINQMLGDNSSMRTMDLLRWPGVVEESDTDLEPIKAQTLGLLDQALDELLQHREREGASLRDIVLSRCNTIRQIVTDIRGRLPDIRDQLNQRLRARISELDLQVDPARLEQELVIQLQKMDVDEELVRLDTHVREVTEVLSRGEPVGRRLDFLMQELNREANTLGSKSVALETTGAAVELKVLIEQMREQIQNIE